MTMEDRKPITINLTIQEIVVLIKYYCTAMNSFHPEETFERLEYFTNLLKERIKADGKT